MFASATLALIVLPLAGPATSADPGPEKDFRPAIMKLDSRPEIEVVAPTHLPVPGSSNRIGPGSQLMIDRPDGSFVCTANFIWTATKDGNKTTYIGAAGHCFLPEGTTSTHGPDADFDPSLATVYVCVSSCEFGGQLGPFFGEFAKLGRVAYARQTTEGVDAANDFGIVEIPGSISGKRLRPSLPVWQGPTGVKNVSEGGSVCVYGNGTATGEVFLTKARTGIGRGLDESRRYWTAVMPSTPGDSGAALVTCGPDDDGMHGKGAAGILTHIGLAQETGHILGTTTGRAVEMTKQDTDISLRLMLQGGKEVVPPAPPRMAPPPPPVKPNETVHPVAYGGSYSWTAGPFTRTAPPEAFFFGEQCNGRGKRSKHCDYEFVKLEVPAKGALLTVKVSTADEEGDDFDLFVFGPSGRLVGESFEPGTPPEVVSRKVVESGVYTIAVDPYAVTNAKYKGSVSLKKPVVPIPPHDGKVSTTKSYKWRGDPPLDVNPVFTCADIVSDFCDNELIYVDVPSGGATLAVDIEANTAGDDFDVCIYTPSGTQECFGTALDEHVKLPVKLSGVYRIGVSAVVAFGTFTGRAALR